MIENIVAHVMPFSFALLPGVMDSPEARAALLAIGLQESEFKYRRQGLGGPARGFWQFEKLGGVKGVLLHPSTMDVAHHVCTELCYTAGVEACYTALEHNDVLACCFARLLLWTTPGLLAGRAEPEKAWHQYLEGWRPGKPRHEAWPANFSDAWAVVTV